MLRWRLESEYSKFRYAFDIVSFDPVESRIEDLWCFTAVHWAGQGTLPCLYIIMNAGKLRGINALLQHTSLIDGHLAVCLLVCAIKIFVMLFS